MLSDIFEIAVIVAAVVYVIDTIWTRYNGVAACRSLGIPVFQPLKKPRVTNDKEREYLDGPL